VTENWPSFHFLMSDLAGILAGFALFSLLAFLPGYAIGWLGDVFEFRARSLPFRLVASVPVSLAVVPITGYTVGRWLGFDAVWLVYVALWVAAVSSGGLRRVAHSSFACDFRRLWPFIVLIGGWMTIAFLSLADLPVGHRLYFSIIDFDYSVRIAFTHSIAAFGLPARNPFFFPGHAIDLRYHYLWMIPCAQICRLGMPLVDARSAFIAGTMWVGVGMISLIPLSLRLFDSSPRILLRQSRIGIALLAVTGLDIVPALLMVWLNRAGFVSGISPSVEWWNEQVDGWLYTMLWEPHYICSLIACLTGFLIVWSLPPQAPRQQRIVSGILAGIAFASAVGCGIYVALVFATFLGIWLPVILVRKRWGEAAALIIGGGVAAVLIRPFFASLQDSFSRGVGGAHLFEFSIRAFAPVEILLKLSPHWQRSVADLLLLPLNYFIELGVFFAVGWIFRMRLKARKRSATRAELAGCLLAATSVLICTFVKSTVVANNDLGWRGFLPAQFVLLLWAADILSERDSRTPLIRLLLVLGLAGAIYDMAILRFYPLLSDLGEVPGIAWLGNDNLVGLRTFANREAYEWLRARTPETSVIQQNPEPVYQDTFFGAYGDRQTIAVGGDCGSGFGGDPRECASVMKTLVPLFAGAQVMADVCRTLPINDIVARDTDRAWRDRSSWVWTDTPVFRNNFVRIFACQSVLPREFP
jgi:hypothetical protein